MSKISVLIITMWGMLLTPLTAAEGNYGTAEEFGSQTLSLTPVFGTQQPRLWGRGKEKIRATLQGIRGNWGQNAVLQLRTPRHRNVRMPAVYLSDEDIEFVEKWLKDNKLEPLQTSNMGTLYVRLISVTPTAVHGELTLVFLNADGKVSSWIIDEQPAPTGNKNKQRLSLTPAGMERVKKWPQAKDTTDRDLPFPIAASPNEALVYSELRGVNTVVLFLGQRGGAKDTAFRFYLQQHPDAAAVWSNSYVFLLVYADENGLYSPQTCRELNEFANHHNVQPTGYTSWQLSVIPSELAYGISLFNNDVLSGITLIGNPDVGKTHILLQRIFVFNIRTEDFLNTEPTQVPFLQQ